MSSKRHDGPGPRSQTCQDLFATYLFYVCLSAEKSREARAEDGDQIGDVRRVRVVRAGKRIVLLLQPFARRYKIRHVLGVRHTTAELHFSFLSRRLCVQATVRQIAAAVLVEVVVLYRGHHMRVQIQDRGFCALCATVGCEMSTV